MWVSAGLESRLDEPLRLVPLGVLRVLLEPSPNLPARSWTVVLLPDPQRAGPEREGLEREVGGELAVTFEELLAGAYRFSVRDAAGAVWASQPLEVYGGENSVVVPLRGVRCHGVLRIGGRKTAGHLLLSGEGRGTALAADAVGRFEGVVPGEGRYRARVGLRGASLEAGEVQVPGPGEPCELAIDLAGTRLAGTVVRADGAPVEGALITAVWLRDGTENARGCSDRTGTFVFSALRPGPWVLEATWRSQWSDPVHVEVTGEERPAPVRLVLKDADEFSGRVVSSRGPLAGALLRAIPRRADMGSLHVTEARTDASGTFTLRMMGRAPLVSVVVAAPGLGLQLFAGGPGRQLGDVVLSPDGGVLQVAGDTSCPQLSCLAGVWLVRGTARWPLVALREVTAGPAAAGEVALAPLAPGPWSVCWGDPVSLFSGLEAGLPPPAEGCASGMLAPRGGLRLTVGGAAAAQR